MLWCFQPEDLSLDVISSKYEDFSKPQTNEVRARFYLLLSCRQGNRFVEEWYNAVQTQVSLARYPLETANILHRDIFWVFFPKDKEFVSKTINDSNIDLEKFPASKVRKLAKKMGSSKSTARHIEAVAGDTQAAQINLMRHQRTDLPPSKSKCKQHSHMSKSKKRYSSEHNSQRPPFKKCDPNHAHKRRNRCSKCGYSKHVEGFKCPARKFQCKTCNKHGHLPACATKSNHVLSLHTPRHINCKQKVFTCKKIQYAASQLI